MKLFKCAFLGIVAILLCGCGESGGEFDAINVGKVSVVYENQTLRIVNSALDSAESQNLINNNSVRSTQNSPASWCKKSESKGAEVPPADFLLEAEKRGSPPKSEKRQLLGNSFKNSWGEREQGGAALLREKTSENDGKGFAESIKESQGGLPRRFCESARNDEFLDSSLRKCSAQNDKIKQSQNGNFGEKVAESSLDSAIPKHKANSSIADEFLGLCEASDEDRTNGSSRKRTDALPKKSLRDAEFADSAPQDFILFFFTSTCGVCKAQLPILEQLRAQGIKIYAILGDVPDISKASAFVRAHKISLPLFYESGARRFFTSAVGGVKGVPVMVVFKDGKMKEKFIGLTPKGTLLRTI